MKIPNNIIETHPELINAHWDYDLNKQEKNKPTMYTAESHKKVWWKCEHGHKWEERIDNMANGSVCPYCAGKKALRGVNDITITNPEIMSEWDYEKNNEHNIIPTDYTAQSKKIAYWKCTEGHEYKEFINQKINGVKCVFCATKKAKVYVKGENDLETVFPYIAEEWDNKNDFEPASIMARSGKRVHWKCKKGHQWETRVINRTKHKSICPYCSGRKAWEGYNDLATTHPMLSTEWNFEKNNELGIFPTTVSAGSKRIVWWKCEKGHEWLSSVSNRIIGGNCPYCSGKKAITGENDFATLHPEMLKEWDYEKNDALGIYPNEIKSKCNKRVHWKCEHGHEWFVSVKNRVTMNTGCPYCNKKRKLKN